MAAFNTVGRRGQRGSSCSTAELRHLNSFMWRAISTVSQFMLVTPVYRLPGR